jgi:phosphatidylserine synthase
MSIFSNEKIWRRLTNFWTMAFMVFLTLNFFDYGHLEFMTAPLAVIYIGILGLYVSTKEFDRWYELHENKRHPGEWFVLAWTIVIFGLLALSAIMPGTRKVSSEAVAVYIMVLSVFALTQKSKALHARKKESQGKTSTTPK